MHTNSKAILITAAVILVFLVVSSQDYQDEKQAERVYCENVKAGTWPDYNHNAREVCP